MNELYDIQKLKYYIQEVIPLVYTDSLSVIEVLGKVLETLNHAIENQGVIINQVKINMADIATLKHDVAVLQQEIQKFINGDYTDRYLSSLINWIDNNIQILVGRIVKYVFFGLSGDGHFMAYIPQSWDFIEFDTVMDYQDAMYGHLVLRW